MPVHQEIKVAPNIWKSFNADGQHVGWRVYTRRRDARTGKSAKHSKRFAPEYTLEELEHYRDSFKLESKKLRIADDKQARVAAKERAGLFPADAEKYLALKTVKAMPSFKDRKADIERWVKVFGNRPRRSITTLQIDEQLQAWIDEGYAASTVNNRRTALMHLFTRLDGRGAANPVREAKIYEEPDLEARGIPYPFVHAILDALPSAIRYTTRKDAKVRQLKTPPRIHLEAVTGMYPGQIGLLERARHFSIAERWYVIPRRKKGQQRKPRSPRPMTRKYMTDSQAEAFTRFDTLECYGKYSASSRRRMFNEAVRTAEARIRKELNDPSFAFPPKLVPRDLRHSFGTELYRQTKNLNTVAELLDHSSTRMAVRYSLGAVSDVLKDAAEKFERATARKKTAPAPTLKTAAKPPGRPKGGTRSGGTTIPVTR